MRASRRPPERYTLALGSGCAVVRDQQTVGPYVDDTTITTRVKAKFTENQTASAMAIGVETLRVVVQLSGFAKSVEGARWPSAWRAACPACAR